MAKNKFLTNMQVQHQVVLDREVNYARKLTKQFVMDMVQITLGRLGMAPEWFVEFYNKFIEVCKDYEELVLTDVKDDEHLDYSKAIIDRELSQYIPQEHFVPYDERYK